MSNWNMFVGGLAIIGVTATIGLSLLCHSTTLPHGSVVQALEAVGGMLITAIGFAGGAHLVKAT